LLQAVCKAFRIGRREEIVRFAGCSAVILVSLFTLAASLADSVNSRTDSQFVTVDVRVSDKRGNPVTDLSRESFQLFVGGKPEKILSFQSVSGQGGPEASPGLEPGKIVLILFDVHAMDASHIAVAQRAATNFVNRHMGPDDRLGVAVYGRSLDIVQPFTGNRQKVLEAIARPLSSFGSSALERGFSGAEGIQLARNVLRSFRALSTDLGRLDARKSVMVFTQDFATPTGEDFSRLVEAARSSRVSFYTLITTGSIAQRRETPRRPRPSEARPAIRSVSSTGIAAMSFGAFSQQRGGPPAQTPTGPTGSGISDPSIRESVTGLDAVTANRDVLQNLAKETYGEVVREANDLNRALDDFDRQLSNYYLLGFLLDGGRCRQSQKIEVKLNAKDVRLNYPRQYLPDATADDSTGPKTPKAVSSTLESAALPGAANLLRFRSIVSYAADEVARVLLFADPGQVADAPATVLLAVALDESNRVSARYEAAWSSEPGAGDRLRMPAHAWLLLRPGTYRVRLAVADDQGLRSIGEEKLVVASLPPGKLGASSLVVTERVAALPESVRALSPPLVGKDHPLTFKGYEVVPSLTNEVDRQKPLALFLSLYNVKDVTAAPQLRSEARLLNESGETFLLAPVQHLETSQTVGTGTVLLGFTVSVSRMKPGPYRLVLETRDPAAGQTVSCETPVVLR